MTEAPWVIRRAVPEDEGCLVPLWLRSFAHGYRQMRRGAHRRGSDQEIDFWNRHAPIVEYLLRAADVETMVLCDPQRATYADRSPAIIWAFASFGPGDVVHQVVVKRAYAEFGAEMTRALLGDRLERPHICSHELTEMLVKPGRGPRCGVALPDSWLVDEHWLAQQLLPKRRVGHADR